MKRNLFDSYDSATPISDALLEKMGFQYMKAYRTWLYIVKDISEIPPIIKGEKDYFVPCDDERCKGLKGTLGDPLNRHLQTIGDLKKVIEDSGVLYLFEY